MSPVLERAIAVGRGVGLILVAAGAVVLFAHYTGEHYPIGQWMFWVYLEIWAYALLFGGGSIGAGLSVMRLLRPGPLPLRERVVFTLAAGVFAFFWLVFLGGIVGILRPWFSIAMPVVCMALGALSSWRAIRRWTRAIRASRRRGVRARSIWTTPVTLFGALGIFLVYYALLSPRNIAFDAHFYHLGIAQEYAVDHAIRAFPEGWMPGALPQLASVIYAWGFSLPGLDMFGRLVLVQHLELIVFLFTLMSIPALVRVLVPRLHPRATWAALFLFPGILIYDSTLSGAADHVAAFWAIPVWLSFRRAFRELEAKSTALFALTVAAGVLTKYQTMYFVVVPILVLIGRAFWLVGRRVWSARRIGRPIDRREWLVPIQGLGVALAVGLVLSSAHWLKNWVFYGDPLFPYLNEYFGSARWGGADEGRLFAQWNEWQSKDWVPQGSFFQRFKESLGATFSFSFRPHDWSTFHQKIPVFGSLYTLSLALLPFLARGRSAGPRPVPTRRIWGLVVATQIGLFIWYWTMHQDRYLQALLPWMAAVVAATIALAWQAGWHGRVAVGALVAFQIVWGADAYLYPAHSMSKQAAMTVTNELLSMRFKKDYDNRYRVSGALFDIGSSKELPPTARVLIHENNPRLGIWRPLLSDMPGWQFGLRYEKYASPKAMQADLERLGVGYLVARSRKSRGYDSLGSDLRFFDYLLQDAVSVKAFGEFTLFKVAPHDAPLEGGDRVAYFGCARLYERGIHRLATLDVRDKQAQKEPPTRAAEEPGEPADLLPKADFVVTEPKCGPEKGALGDFVSVGTRGKEELWARKRALRIAPEPAPSSATPPPPSVEDHLLDQ